MRPDSDRELLNALRRALPTPPRTDEEARVWLEFLSEQPLPFSELLADTERAIDLISGPDIEPRAPRVPDSDDLTSTSFRRAARNGRAITEETEAAMQRARESANSSKDGV